MRGYGRRNRMAGFTQIPHFRRLLLPLSLPLRQMVRLPLLKCNSPGPWYREHSITLYGLVPLLGHKIFSITRLPRAAILEESLAQQLPWHPRVPIMPGYGLELLRGMYILIRSFRQQERRI